MRARKQHARPTQSGAHAAFDRANARLDEGASQASLPAMSSYERKLIHDIVADRGLVSESYGEGSDRHTVIRRGRPHCFT